MKILLITYSYAPDLTPRAFRWSALADRLANEGHTLHVLCAVDAAAATDATPSEVRVHRVRDWLINASTRVTPAATYQDPLRANEPKAAWRSRFRKLAKFIWRTMHWPDYACGWILPAAAKARDLCRIHRFDWVISVSHPFSGHMVAWLIRKYTHGAQWFVDIGDPFCLMAEPPPNNRRLYARLNRWMESRILDCADAISVTTVSTQRLYEVHFSSVCGKIHMIPPLLSLPDFALTTKRHPSNGPIRLIFVGTLYRRLRSPRFLLDCFSALAVSLPQGAIELHFYGAINDCSDEFDACPAAVREAVLKHGLVGRAEVMQAMVDADVLVNIGNDSESQLASKVIEYMAVGKPILNLISLVGDTSVAALADYPAVLTLSRDSGISTSTVERMRDFVVAPPIVPSTVSAAMRERYSAARISAEYEKILSLMKPVP
ncbi:glycosyltransferase [Laribacter hongkongensis]|uniref:glycosyltransferase n=1 Tax=Laribacter hongkongensis TaxID=168471 RepID=UPI001EFE7016|nr:glycosyltransferase [Laribacter hongkongensis]MCG9059539.1 glycosyltransferase [Laribacter hongkongensis]MCG9086577.1 glycosyltransferase [Laribacter hongkongensis]